MNFKQEILFPEPYLTREWKTCTTIMRNTLTQSATEVAY